MKTLKKPAVYLPLIYAAFVIGLNYKYVLLFFLNLLAPFHGADFHWQKIIAEPGKITLNLPSGKKTISYEPSCSNRPGTNPEFSFFVRKGKVNKLLILFSGGGACWSGQNCIPGDGSSGLLLDGRTSYVDQIFPYMHGALQYTSAGRYGMLDHTDSENPIKDWSAVWIFSCDGSVFWGSNDQIYDDPFYGGGRHTIRHRGFDNTMAVLAYLKEHFKNPEQILVSGQSAGGYGTALLFPYFKEAWPNARADVLIDSSAGIVPRISRGFDYNFLKLAVPLWQAHKNSPDWINSLPTDIENFTNLDLDDLMLIMSREYPQMHIGEYTPAWDLGQILVYYIMLNYTRADIDWRSSIYSDDRPEDIPQKIWCDWNKRLIERRKKITRQAELENLKYRFYLAPGRHHGIGKDFNGISDNMAFKKWLTALVGPRATSRDEVPENFRNVWCEDDCKRPQEVFKPQDSCEKILAQKEK